MTRAKADERTAPSTPATISSADAPDAAGPPARTRAPSLPAGERRAVIVAATVPLLLTEGAGVTTRQIAEAAGIAEGTIFGVFPDKETLIQAAIETAFDRAPLDDALRAVDLSLPLEARLTAAVEILRRRVTTIWKLMTAVGMTKPPEGTGSNADPRGRVDLSALAALFEPDRRQLRRDPQAAAHLLQGLTFAGTHPALIADEPLSSTEIVSLLLDGIRGAPGSGEAG